ncbi:MAG: hypothetical protein FWC50_12575 [Planctomycetaceae bacterium]|nr:hypothetical protein [Planctomycetaceae bacterium]
MIIKRTPVFVVLLLFCNVTVAQQASTDVWEQPVSVSWNGGPLRQSLETFAKVRRFGFILDRRIDPGTPLHLEVSRQPVAVVFSQIAEKYQLGFCRIGQIAYLGPKDAAKILPFLVTLRAEQAAKFPDHLKRQFSAPREFHSGFLATPADVLQSLAEEMALDGTDFQSLPHDLWPEIVFPEATPLEIFSLFLIGFDSTFVISDEVSENAKKIRPIPIPYRLVLTRTFQGKGGEQLSGDLPYLRQIAPTAIIEKTQQGISVRASLDELARIDTVYHQRLSEVSAKPASASTPTSTTPPVQPGDSTISNAPNSMPDAAVRLKDSRYTAKIDAKPLDATLRFFAEKMQLELVINEKAFANRGIKINTPVSFQLENNTFQEVFEKCLQPVNGKFRLNGNRLEVY